MLRLSSTGLAGMVLAFGIAITPLASLAQDHKPSNSYHDKKHNDDHEWNDHEDQAYRIWQKNSHRKNMEFGKRPANDQQAYWNWRHTHSDALLKINIR